ncbi:hypothetical protein NGUA15_04085 [Salmonella enterica]|nr:hypothetical protein NGUA15_04085 [Salmonella enterica]
MLLQRITRNATMLGDNRRHQRRHNQHMRDIVTIVGHQHRLLARQDDDIANGVFLDLKLIHLQRVSDELTSVGGRNG